MPPWLLFSVAGRAIPGEPSLPGRELAWWAKIWSMSVAGFLAFNLVDIITLARRPVLLHWLSLSRMEQTP